MSANFKHFLHKRTNILRLR